MTLSRFERKASKILKAMRVLLADKPEGVSGPEIHAELFKTDHNWSLGGITRYCRIMRCPSRKASKLKSAPDLFRLPNTSLLVSEFVKRNRGCNHDDVCEFMGTGKRDTHPIVMTLRAKGILDTSDKNHWQVTPVYKSPPISIPSDDDDNERIMHMVHQRLAVGRKTYGQGIRVDDDTDWEKMLLEEIFDAMVYAATLMVSLQKGRMLENTALVDEVGKIDDSIPGTTGKISRSRAPKTPSGRAQMEASLWDALDKVKEGETISFNGLAEKIAERLVISKPIRLNAQKIVTDKLRKHSEYTVDARRGRGTLVTRVASRRVKTTV